jgi:hypothetical protein
MSTTRSPDRLYELLPAVYRQQDADQNYALRALLRILTSQVDVVEQDIVNLYDNLFIETCSRWVIPYIGDLVSNNLLYDAGRIPDTDTAKAIFTDLVGPDLRPPLEIRTRADVAKTIYYRRRKGTLPMLEELARDVTGWAAHAVEFLQLLGWTQNLEHSRPQAAWFDVRAIERDERVDGPFDEASHSVDVRPISQFEGWHSIKNVGFFLWRLESNPLVDVPARQAGAPWQFHFSPLGNDTPLFTHLRSVQSGNLSTELDVPGPIRRTVFAADLASTHPTLPAGFSELYGRVEGPPGTVLKEDASLFVIIQGAPDTPVPVTNVVCRRLDPWPAAQPTGPIVAIDVVSGRIAVGDGFPNGPLSVTFHYGFPAQLGGGTYSRKKWLKRINPAARLTVGAGSTFATVAAALTEWQTTLAAAGGDTVISIEDSDTYALPATQIALPDNAGLTIEAADGQRPLLQTDPGGLVIKGLATSQEERGTFTLSGVVVEGWIRITDIGHLRLIHTTLVPGHTIAEGAAASTDPSISVEGGGAKNARLRVQLAFSLTGRISCPAQAVGLDILDSIVDGDIGGVAIAGPGNTSGPPLNIARSTVLGRTVVHELDASESIFTDRVRVDRRQAGCVRFSYVTRTSQTPRRYRCQPDLAIRAALDEALATDPSLTQADQDAIATVVAERVQPAFVATAYGRPEYCQLRLLSPVEIRTGTADSSEMGAYSHLKQPQRESNLRIRLEEYLPFGLEAGVIYVT